MFDFFKKKEHNKQNNQVEETSAPDVSVEKKNFFSLSFDGLKKTIEKTSSAIVSNITQKFEAEEEFDEFLLDDMEELLIKADLGVSTSTDIVDKLRKKMT